MTKEKCESILNHARKELSKREFARVEREAKKMTELTSRAYKNLVDFICKELEPNTIEDAALVMATLGSVADAIIGKIGEFSSTLPSPENVYGYNAMNFKLEQLKEQINESIKINNRNMF